MSVEEFFEEHIDICLKEAENEIKKYNENKSYDCLSKSEQSLDSAKSAFDELTSNDKDKYKALNDRINYISTIQHKYQVNNFCNDISNISLNEISQNDFVIIGQEVLKQMIEQREKLKETEKQLDKLHETNDSSKNYIEKIKNINSSKIAFWYFVIGLIIAFILIIS